MNEQRFSFTPATFRALLAGNLSLGATFWVGLIVADLTAAMFFVWISAALAVVPPGAAAVLGWLGRAGLVALALYMAAMLAAMLRAVRLAPGAGGWRWAALGFAIAHVIAAAALMWYSLAS
jgi:hypothetical protein